MLESWDKNGYFFSIIKIEENNCFVKALTEDTSIEENSKSYSHPLTIEEARERIQNNRGMFGGSVNNCVGLSIENTLEGIKKIKFSKPVIIKK